MPKYPSIKDYSNFTQDFVPILNRYRIDSSNLVILDNLKKSTVYKFLSKESNFVCALGTFIDSRRVHGDAYLKHTLDENNNYYEYFSISLMSLFANAMVAHDAIESRFIDELPTVNPKEMRRLAYELEKVDNFIEAGYFLIPVQIRFIIQNALSILGAALNNEALHSYPIRSTGLELLALNHFVYNLYNTYRVRYPKDAEQTIKIIILNLVNMFDGNHEDSVKFWIKEAMEAHYSLFKHYYFLEKDVKNIEKYGLVSGKY